MSQLDDNNSQIEAQVKAYQQRASTHLSQCLIADTLHPVRLHKAMRYAVLQGGKRTRPLLVYLTGLALELDVDSLDIPACAVELIHAYSLVHDDLPCMDDDDLRRGQPTCHKAFDEATAVLVGDGLQALSFQQLSEAPDLSAEQIVEMIKVLSHAAGSRGMVGGQAIDMAATGQQLSLAELENMHVHKTGALITASVQLACIAGQATQIQRQALLHYAHCIGLAFQIQDDVLDETADTQTLGKTQGSDKALNKPTYPMLLGLAESKQRAQELVSDAIQSLESFGTQADGLRWLANYIINRQF